MATLLVSCTAPRSPRDAVLTGTLDSNLTGIAGKPVAVAADGVQKVAIVDTQVSRDPCDGNAGLNFNVMTNSTTPVVLVPATANQNVFICSIFVSTNTVYKSDGSNDELINITEGGGTNCANSPTVLEGDANPANGRRISSGGNGGFIQGGAGATIYRTTAVNRGICAKAAGSHPVGLSGSYIKQ
ncbi:MAG: hypothetical protein C5B60_11880 [Chloroflexi bacterium]|nr:MAG: hypothetical protein C5B60_11880 [Chloroflexota bacterium]